MLKLSVAITTYNRFDLTIKSFEQVLDHPNIDEVVIFDDGSDKYYYELLENEFDSNNKNKKVKLFKSAINLGMSRAKRTSVLLCENDWVILFDSDNVLTHEYIDAFLNQEGVNKYLLYGFNDRTIYMPDFAKPNFDYTNFSGRVLGCENIKSFLLSQPNYGALMNTCNYIVPRERYLKVWEQNLQMKGTDTYWFNYLWLREKNIFNVVKGMQYDHLVHEGSEWMQYAQYNMQKAREIDQLIREL